MIFLPFVLLGIAFVAWFAIHPCPPWHLWTPIRGVDGDEYCSRCGKVRRLQSTAQWGPPLPKVYADAVEFDAAPFDGIGSRSAAAFAPEHSAPKERT